MTTLYYTLAGIVRYLAAAQNFVIEFRAGQGFLYHRRARWNRERHVAGPDRVA